MGNSSQSEHQLLGEFEELVLIAILRLRDNAYGVTIRQLLESETHRPTSIGSVYTTLDRLEDKGYIKSNLGDATPERGGKAKRFFELTNGGAEALNRAQQRRARLMNGLGGDWLPVTS